jgi:hypothetical protein
MNFLEGEIQVQEGFGGVHTSIGFLKLDKDRAVRLEAMSGRKVIAGISLRISIFLSILSEDGILIHHLI